jgi:hypothetical protein
LVPVSSKSPVPFFGQCTGAGKVAGVAAVAGLLEGQRGVVEDRALQAAGVTAGAATVESGAAAVGIGATEQQRTIAVFHQTAGARDHAAEGGVLGAGQGQLPGQIDRVRQLQRRCAVQLRATTDAKRAGADGAVVAENQRTGVQLRATCVGVAAIKGQA